MEAPYPEVLIRIMLWAGAEQNSTTSCKVRLVRPVRHPPPPPGYLAQDVHDGDDADGGACGAGGACCDGGDAGPGVHGCETVLGSQRNRALVILTTLKIRYHTFP